jgi:hypothetical protein
MSFGSKKTLAVVAVAALGLAGTLSPAQAAANYARPKSATPLHVPLVPAYAACTSPNRTHGAPLAFDSCAPPRPHSDLLTVGTPDANGAAANSVGFVRLRVIAGDPGTPADEADVALTASITDVRNRADLTDYTGQVLARLPVRITDLDNSAPSGESAAATVQDSAFGFMVPCTANADPSIGSSCSAATTADAVSPGAIKERMRAIWQLEQIELVHEGPGGTKFPTYVPFVRQGVFVP